MSATRTARHLALVGLACLTLGACVTEPEPSRGVRVRPADSSGQPGAQPSAKSGSDGSAPGVPSGPVANPAHGVTVNAAVRVGFVPIGSLTYDGQTLPLVSPDGRFMVAQSGESPTWPTILAEDGAEPVNRTSLTVFDISANSLKLVTPTDGQAGGLLLGRSADAQGFLVEAPQRDGSRWIGRVAWLTGKVQWLAQGAQVNAHGVLTSKGELAYTRRAIGAAATELVLQAPGHEASVKPAEGDTYAFPMAGDEPNVLYVCRIGARSTDLEMIRVKDGVLGASVLRRQLGASGDPLLAHQVSMTAAGPTPGVARGTVEPGPLSILSPRLGRMSVLDSAQGVFEGLAPKTIAAARNPDPTTPGYFCTAPEGLLFVPKIGTGGPTGAVVTVISTPYVAKTVQADPPALILFGPAAGAPDRLEIVRMMLRAGEAR